MKPIHDRMPVILDPGDYDRWLDRDVPGEEVADLLKPAPDDLLETWRVKDMNHNPEANKGERPGVADP
jgi:putative SOS response-associated peptidase YedK